MATENNLFQQFQNLKREMDHFVVAIDEEINATACVRQEIAACDLELSKIAADYAQQVVDASSLEVSARDSQALAGPH